MAKVICFGNPYLESDNQAVRIGKEIQGEHEVIFAESPDDLLEHDLDEVYILDVANTDEVKLLDDIDKIQADNIVSLHDFDLGFFLKLMKEMGKIKKVRIICIPEKVDKEKVLVKLRG